MTLGDPTARQSKKNPHKPLPPAIQAEIERCLSLTLVRREYGSLGAYCYLNGGSDTFDEFKSGKNYHPFHGEKDLFDQHGNAIAESIQDTERLIVVGQGPWESIEAKELPIISRLPNLKRVDFIDLSEDYNTAAVNGLKAYFNQQGSQVKVESHTVNYLSEDALQAIKPMAHQTTVISTGSTFTNPVNASFEGVPKTDLATALDAFKGLAGDRNKVVLAYDSNNRKADLNAAYNSETLERFYLDGLRFALENSPSIKGLDPEKVEEIFELHREWYPKSSHYAHKLRVREDADEQVISIDNEWIKVDNIPLSPGDEFTVMSCIKPDPRLIGELASGKSMETRFKISGPSENTVHVLKNKAPELKAA